MGGGRGGERRENKTLYMVFVSTDKLAIYSIYLVFLDLGLIKEVD